MPLKLYGESVVADDGEEEAMVMIRLSLLSQKLRSSSTSQKSGEIRKNLEERQSHRLGVMTRWRMICPISF